MSLYLRNTAGLFYNSSNVQLFYFFCLNSSCQELERIRTSVDFKQDLLQDCVWLTHWFIGEETSSPWKPEKSQVDPFGSAVLY